MPKYEGQVIFVDDEKNVSVAFKRNLQRRGYQVEVFDSGKKALSLISQDWPGILVSDIMMPEMDGLTLMKKVRKIDPDLPVVLVTGKGNIPMAVQAMKDGAYDFVEKPVEMEMFQEVVRRALEKRRYVLEVRKLRAELDSCTQLEFQLIGKSPVIERLRKVIENVAASHADILILGETGTGKELTARCLHQWSRRKEKAFVAINCGSIPETIIESELFGHEAGAFTGANQRRVGKFEYANGGTIFLDEIESMPLPLQVKLLRVLQERVVERLGSNHLIPLDIRVVAATKIDLLQACERNEFRKDLYYRLNVVQILLPPLRDHREDIPFLFHYFVEQSCFRHKQPVCPITDETIGKLLNQPWGGNVRELKNAAEKYVLGLDFDWSNSIHATSNSLQGNSPGKKAGAYGDRMSEFEKNLIEKELICHKGNIQRILEALGIPRQTLRDKMKKYGLKRKDYL